MSINTLELAPQTQSVEKTEKPAIPTVELTDEQVDARIIEIQAELDAMDDAGPTSWPDGSRDYYDTMRARYGELDALQQPYVEAAKAKQEESRKRSLGRVGFGIFGRGER